MTLVTPLTPAPTPPSLGSPATFPTLASAFAAWQAASAAEFNTAIGQINAIDFGVLFATVGGTANAITLTASGVTLSTGLRVAFIPTADNSAATTINLNGGGAVNARSKYDQSTALAAGKIKTGVPMVAVYNGTVWVIEDDIAVASTILEYNLSEFSSNSNTYTTQNTFTTPAAGLWYWAISAGAIASVHGKIALGIGGTDYEAGATYDVYSPALFRGVVVELDGATDVVFKAGRNAAGSSVILRDLRATGYRIR